MRTPGLRQIAAAIGFVVLLPVFGAAWPDIGGPESRRMARAKDLIADEQWGRAIEELRVAAADPREPNKAEALFWLAHSLNQENDFAAAVESIRKLEREHASSPWVKPARSLMIELAQKLRRDDVLWWTATPGRPPAVPTVAPRAMTPRRGSPRPAPPPPVDTPTPFPAAPDTPAPPAPAGRASTPAPPPPPPSAWFVETWSPDTDQRILALGSLIHTDADKVIPMLRKIALEEDNPGAARRAVFVLTQSGKPEAMWTVVEVARRGPEPVRVAAVRGIGSFGGPEVSKALLQVYSTANALVKKQVVTTLGQRAEAPALLRIAQSEADRALRASAIVTLGRCGGRDELYSLYVKADRESKRPIINGLFMARGEDELIRIAEREKDSQLRAEVHTKLRLLGTPKTRAYLARITP
jgi:hypothetical protein